MKLSLVFITILFALSTVDSLSLDLGVNLDISAEIGAILNENLNIGTNILSLITGTVASVSSDLTVAGTLTMGTLLNSPILSIDEGVTMTVDTLVLNGGDITVTGGGYLVILGGVTINAETSISGNVNISGAVEFTSDALVSLAGALRVHGEATFQAGSSLIIDATNYATFTANTTIAATAEIACEADAELHFHASVLGSGSITANGFVRFGGSVEADVDVDTDVEIEAAVAIGATGASELSGRIRFAGNFLASVGASVSANANAVVVFSSQSTLQALEVAADATVEFTAEAEAEIQADVTINAGAKVEAKGFLSILGDVSGSGELIFSSSSNVESEVSSTTVAARVSVSGSSSLFIARLNAATTFSSNLEFSGSGRLSVQEGSSLIVQGDASFEADVNISLTAGATLEAQGSLLIQGNIFGGGSLVLSSNTNVESEIRAATIETSVSLSGSASLFVARSNARTTFARSLSIDGSARLSIAAGSSLTVQGDVSLGADVAYGVIVSSSDAVDVLTVEGEIELGGTLELNADIDLEIGAEATILFYGSRADASVFAQITVGASKRSLSESGYDIEYEDDRAIITYNSSPSIILSAIALILLAFLSNFLHLFPIALFSHFHVL